jgi:ribulose-5-phosphate 4-epimerase/fuculose-1-phosphate aldolase
MIEITDAHFETFIKEAHRVGEYKLTVCSSGNLSWRIGNKVMISGTSSWVPQLVREKIAVLDLDMGDSLNGVKSSMETGFHLGVLRNRPEMNVVLHVQSPFATTIACMPVRPKSYNVIAEVAAYPGAEIAEVPYLRPGSPELANAVVKALTKCDAALLLNHGQVFVGKDFDDVIQKAVFFELGCSILVRSGFTANTMTEDQIQDLYHYIKGKETK